jgi:Core-2/I-Branching enzyme
MRVCYLIQSHRSPRQIARLVATLGALSPGSLVLVVHDARACDLERRELRSAAEVQLLTGTAPIERGYLSLLDPYLQGVAWLRDQEADYDWLVYLSGQDYPTHPLAWSERQLAAAVEADGFVRYWPALGTEGPWRRRKQGRLRYYYQYRELPAVLGPLLRLAKGLNGWQSLWHLHLVYGRRLGWRARRTPFEGGRVCYAGWQWTTLRRGCAEAVLASLEGDPELWRYYQRTICPDESIVQTILVNDRRFRLVNDNLRYADTSSARDGRPRLLGEADLDLITQDAYHFARKFELETAPRVLDRLDERLGLP